MTPQARFYAVLHHFNIEMGVISDRWQNLATHYNQPHRHYHNLLHIKAMLRHFSAIEKQLNQPDNVALAIFYHDAIYDPTQNDNEAKSIDFFVQELGDYVPKSVQENVSELILATQNHELANFHNTDMAYFLDMDLSILGQDTAVYQQYANAIRQEYHHVKNDDYKISRLAVLQRFLQRERLYFSDRFFLEFEQCARKNLATEISSLCPL